MSENATKVQDAISELLRDFRRKLAEIEGRSTVEPEKPSGFLVF